MIRFNQITLLHGRDELPSGSGERLEAILRATYPAIIFARPFVPFDLDTKDAVKFVLRNYVSRMETDSLLVGLERGGLIACAAQTTFPALRLSVCAVNSPTEEDGIVLEPGTLNRLALYSSAYPPIKGRCDWKTLTPLAYDVSWLTPGCKFYYPLAYLISLFSQGADMDKQVAMLFPS